MFAREKLIMQQLKERLTWIVFSRNRITWSRNQTSWQYNVWFQNVIFRNLPVMILISSTTRSVMIIGSFKESTNVPGTSTGLFSSSGANSHNIVPSSDRNTLRNVRVVGSHTWDCTAVTVTEAHNPIFLAPSTEMKNSNIRRKFKQMLVVMYHRNLASSKFRLAQQDPKVQRRIQAVVAFLQK